MHSNETLFVTQFVTWTDWRTTQFLNQLFLVFFNFFVFSYEFFYSLLPGILLFAPNKDYHFQTNIIHESVHLEILTTSRLVNPQSLSWILNSWKFKKEVRIPEYWWQKKISMLCRDEWFIYKSVICSMIVSKRASIFFFFA